MHVRTMTYVNQRFFTAFFQSPSSVFLFFVWTPGRSNLWLSCCCNLRTVRRVVVAPQPKSCNTFKVCVNCLLFAFNIAYLTRPRHYLLVKMIYNVQFLVVIFVLLAVTAEAFKMQSSRMSNVGSMKMALADYREELAKTAAAIAAPGQLLSKLFIIIY